MQKNKIRPTRQKVSVVIARSVAEVEGIRKDWIRCEPFPIADIDYFLAIINSQQKIVRPHVLMLKVKKDPKALIVGRIEYIPKTFIVGGVKIYSSEVKTLIIDIGCLIGDLSAENCTIVIKELYQSLKEKEADVVSFNEVSTDSDIYKMSRTIPGFLFRDYFPKIQGHYKMTLPSSSAEFYKKRKKAKNLRRIKNRLHREFEGNIEVQCFRNPDDVDRLCKDAEKISRTTYQFAAGNGIVNDIETRQKFSHLAKKGWLLAYILYINKEPCAFEGGIYFNRTYYADYCGYNNKYKKYEIGTYLELMIIETQSNDPAFSFYDFGWMDTMHKTRYCDIVEEEASFNIYQPSLKGVSLNAKKIIYSVSDLGIRKMIGSYKRINNKIRKK